MKSLIMSLMLLTLGTAKASLNDFECSFKTRKGADVLVEVERSRFSGSKRIDVTVNSDEGVERFQYFTMARVNTTMRRIEYNGGGVDLDIDLFPDTQPRFGRRYSANFRSFDVDGYTYYTYCQYTGF